MLPPTIHASYSTNPYGNVTIWCAGQYDAAGPRGMCSFITVSAPASQTHTVSSWTKLSCTSTLTNSRARGLVTRSVKQRTSSAAFNAHAGRLPHPHGYQRQRHAHHYGPQRAQVRGRRRGGQADPQVQPPFLTRMLFACTELYRCLRYGYRTTPEILKFVKENEDLGTNLCAAAHLIHGSSEGRFKVTHTAAAQYAAVFIGLSGAGDVGGRQDDKGGDRGCGI